MFNGKTKLCKSLNYVDYSKPLHSRSRIKKFGEAKQFCPVFMDDCLNHDFGNNIV